jgi:hypothetical protein
MKSRHSAVLMVAEDAMRAAPERRICSWATMRERMAASAVSVRRSNWERASSNRLCSSANQPAAVSASAAESATHGMGECKASAVPSNRHRIVVPEGSWYAWHSPNAQGVAK